MGVLLLIHEKKHLAGGSTATNDRPATSTDTRQVQSETPVCGDESGVGCDAAEWVGIRLRLKLPGEFTRLEDAAFGDDAGDQLGRGHVEGGIVDGHAGRRDRMATMDGSDF